MAIKALMLKRRIDLRTKALEELLAKDEEFATRESELAKALEEASNDEEIDVVEAETQTFTEEKNAHEEAKKALEDEIDALKEDLAAEEQAQEVAPVEPVAEEPIERKENETMSKRNIFESMDMQTRTSMFERDDVKGWINEFRSAISEKRALNNIGLTIPEVFLGYIRENIENYSKLYKHVNVRKIGGTGREVVQGSIPEAVWTECCANINELSLTWNDVETGCFKVAGYFKVCNAQLEDSDINLASELLTAIGQAIGFALDKAILYGKNTATNNKMPEGIVSRLVQTEAPTDYPATARPWEDLHTTNVISITAANSTGLKLFQGILRATKAMKGKYSRGTKVWVMNEATYTELMAEAMAFNANGAIVAAVNGAMPVVGGAIEVLDFVPDNVIIAGYFDLYLLAERAGQKFATSEHAFFLQDATAFRGTARYDGKAVIPEAFMAIGINGATPTSAMEFAADTANA